MFDAVIVLLLSLQHLPLIMSMQLYKRKCPANVKMHFNTFCRRRSLVFVCLNTRLLFCTLDFSSLRSALSAAPRDLFIHPNSQEPKQMFVFRMWQDLPHRAAAVLRCRYCRRTRPGGTLYYMLQRMSAYRCSRQFSSTVSDSKLRFAHRDVLL